MEIPVYLHLIIAVAMALGMFGAYFSVAYFRVLNSHSRLSQAYLSPISLARKGRLPVSPWRWGITSALLMGLASIRLLNSPGLFLLLPAVAVLVVAAICDAKTRYIPTELVKISILVLISWNLLYSDLYWASLLASLIFGLLFTAATRLLGQGEGDIWYIIAIVLLVPIGNLVLYQIYLMVLILGQGVSRNVFKNNQGKYFPFAPAMFLAWVITLYGNFLGIHILDLVIYSHLN